MSSLEDFNNARQHGDTVGHQWKRLSDSRDSVPPSDPFREAVRLSASNPEPFPIDPNAPTVDRHGPAPIIPNVEVASDPRMNGSTEFTLGGFGRSSMDEWLDYWRS